MNELIKYFEALEARLAAQEARLCAQDAKIAALEQRLAEAEQQRTAMQQQLAALEQRLAEQAQAEQEVEVELVYPEDEEVTIELPQQEETSAEAEPKMQDNPENPENPEYPESPTLEPQAEPQPEVARQATPEPVAEQPAQELAVEQPTAEPVVEQPVAEEPKTEAKRAPQQTTLFGAPVSDIRQAVSIGDRFLFQRELFAGNAERLQQTLTELNKLHSLDEAVALVDKFGWDKQSTTYELFLNVLRRRFQ